MPKPDFMSEKLKRILPTIIEESEKEIVVPIKKSKRKLPSNVCF